MQPAPSKLQFFCPAPNPKTTFSPPHEKFSLPFPHTVLDIIRFVVFLYWNWGKHILNPFKFYAGLGLVGHFFFNVPLEEEIVTKRFILSSVLGPETYTFLGIKFVRGYPLREGFKNKHKICAQLRKIVQNQDLLSIF